MEFKPHGLIRTPVQEKLYERVRAGNNPRENTASALLLNCLRNVFDLNWAISSEFYPTETSKHKSDLGIEYIESATGNLAVLCFNEVKRTERKSEGALEALETQAFGYCREYLKSHPDRFVYATTSAGHLIRLWRCNPDGDAPGWLPFWGSLKAGDLNQYKDLGSDEDDVERYFNMMKLTPPTPAAGQTLGPYVTGQTGTYVGAGPFYTGPSYSRGIPASSGSSLPTYKYPSGMSVGPMSTAASYSSGPALSPDTEMVDEENPIAGPSKTREERREETRHEIKLKRVARLMHAVEYVFNDEKGKERRTVKSDWGRAEIFGRMGWIFRYHGRVYTWSHKELPS